MPDTSEPIWASHAADIASRTLAPVRNSSSDRQPRRFSEEEAVRWQSKQVNLENTRPGDVIWGHSGIKTGTPPREHNFALIIEEPASATETYAQATLINVLDPRLYGTASVSAYLYSESNRGQTVIEAEGFSALIPLASFGPAYQELARLISQKTGGSPAYHRIIVATDELRLLPQEVLQTPPEYPNYQTFLEANLNLTPLGPMSSPDPIPAIPAWNDEFWQEISGLTDEGHIIQAMIAQSILLKYFVGPGTDGHRPVAKYGKQVELAETGQTVRTVGELIDYYLKKGEAGKILAAIFSWWAGKLDQLESK